MSIHNKCDFITFKRYKLLDCALTIYFTVAKQVQIACSSYKKAVECCNLVFSALDSAWDSPDQVSILGIFICAWSPQAPVTVTGEKS